MNNDCINWDGLISPQGYGHMWFEGRMHGAHRIAYLKAFGEFDRSMHVCHTCDNKKCINPKHLFLGTSKDNMQDKANKKRCNSKCGEESGRAKLTAEQVKNIRASSLTYKELSEHYKVSVSNIGSIKTGNSWKVIGK